MLFLPAGIQCRKYVNACRYAVEGVPPLSVATDEQTFTEELAELSDRKQMREFVMVASKRTIDAIRAALADDVECGLLKDQVAAGWLADTSQLSPELKPYATFADELVVSGGRSCLRRESCSYSALRA